jgi:hypothetical protein
MEVNKTTGKPSVLATERAFPINLRGFHPCYAQIRESYVTHRNPALSPQVTAKPVPEAAQLLIAQPNAWRSVAASVRAIIDDWRNPRRSAVEPGEIKAIWSKKRYKAQVWSFIGYGALIGAVYALPPIATTADKGTVVEVETTTKITVLSPLLPTARFPSRSLRMCRGKTAFQRLKAKVRRE